MLTHELLRNEGILVLTPESPLEAADFERVAREIDPYIQDRGGLFGVLIHAEAFPGWSDLEALASHIRFIESHHKDIQRIAMVSDSAVIKEIPIVVGHLVRPEVRHFPESDFEDALRWLKEAPAPVNA